MKATELKIKDPKVKAKAIKIIEGMDKIRIGEVKGMVKKATDEDLQNMLEMAEEELKRR